MIASLIGTCKLRDVDPQPDLAEVLMRIVNGHLARDLDDLLARSCVDAPPARARLEDAGIKCRTSTYDAAVSAFGVQGVAENRPIR